MAITPIDPPRPIAKPAIAPIASPALQGARDGALRVVVWFRPVVALPDDEITCTPGIADTLFGPGVAQRLLITPETASLRRLLSGALAAALDAAADGGDGGDLVRSTPYSHIYLLCLTGGLGVGHVCDVLGASSNVSLVYPEPTLTVAGVPTQYKSNPVFVNEQAYLKTPRGINAEPAWAKGHTGSGIQAGVVDMDASFSGLPYAPRVVPVPAGTSGAAAGASRVVSTHARQTTGILGCPDNATIGIGAAPEVTLVFSGVTAVSKAGLLAVTTVVGELLTNGKLKAGDVVNVSLGVNAGLDIKQPYPEYAALLAQDGSAAWPHRLVTEQVGADTRPSGVVTTLAVEFEPTMLKLVADFTAKGITVVEAAGNGLVALCQPKGGKDPAWIVAKLGANLAGPWLGGEAKTPLVAFRGGLARKATHSLDRAAAATFADGGGIVVTGGQFSPATVGMIDNIQLNHGNRVDCYVDTPNAQVLGFSPTGGSHVGGSSLCAPVIAGAAAVVQGIAMAQFKAALRPAIVRALLSDPDLGTPTVSGSLVGVMPDLAKLMTLLEKPQGKRDELVKAVQAQQQKSAGRAKAAAATPGSFAHDPYTEFTRTQGPGSWQPLKLAAAGDLFVP